MVQLQRVKEVLDSLTYSESAEGFTRDEQKFLAEAFVYYTEKYRWIPVGEALPPEDTTVELRRPYPHGVSIGIRRSKNIRKNMPPWIINGSCFRDAQAKVTHWRPIPLLREDKRELEKRIFRQSHLSSCDDVKAQEK